MRGMGTQADGWRRGQELKARFRVCGAGADNTVVDQAPAHAERWWCDTMSDKRVMAP
jgi:hypothetical protein